MNYTVKNLLTTFLLALAVQVLIGQTTLQVVTRKIEKEFSFSKSDNLIIRAEKGVIDIQPWQNDKIQVTVKIVVKHKDMDVAKKEIEYIQWNYYQKNTVLQLYNDILLPKNVSLNSIVRVEYLIRMPQYANITIRNNFGQLKVSDLTFTGKIELQYCDLIFEKVNGTIDVSSNIGDLNFLDIRGNLTISSKYSSIRMNNPLGNIIFESNYGSIDINVGNKFSKLNVTAQRCDVSVSNKNCNEFSLNLEAQYAPVSINENCYIRQNSLSNQRKTGSYPTETNTFTYFPENKVPQIAIKSTYGKINLE